MKDSIIQMDNLDECNSLIDHTNTNNSIKGYKYGDIEHLLKGILEAVLTNNTQLVTKYIKLYPREAEDLRHHYYKYKNTENETILVIACINEEITADTLETLFSEIKLKYGDTKYFNKQWYGWEPIHYVARTANPSKLRALIRTLDGDVNSLTYFSENALHVLIQYDKFALPFNVLLHNKRESKSATIIGTEKRQIVECANILIQEGVDVNQTNFWNEPPIGLAVRFRYTELISKLLTVDSIDLDSFKESGITIREYLKWNLGIHLSKSSYIQEDPVKIRFNFLKSRDETGFLTYNPDGLSDNINSLDGEDSYTMLEFCLRKGFLEYLQSVQNGTKRLAHYDIKDTPMLAVFKAKGLWRCIIYLLDNGADITITTKKFRENLLTYASLRGYYPFVAILLQHEKSVIETKDIFEVLSKMTTYHFCLHNYNYYKHCVLYLLLNRLILLCRQNREIITLKKQHILNKILYELNLESNDMLLNNSEVIYQLLHLGASLSYKPIGDTNKNNKMVVERMDYSLLKTHFDDCINGSTFNYNSIIQDDELIYNENKTIRYLVYDKIKNQLLTHPLMLNLIREKWSKIYFVFYADLFFYSLFLLGVYFYTVCQFVGLYSATLTLYYWILLGIHTVKEFIQLILLYRWNYFFEWSNILETITLLCCLLTIYLPNIYSAVASILLSTFIFFVLIGQLPLFTKYTIIFSSIKYFLQYMAFYFIQFIAFSLCFYLVFPFDDKAASLNVSNSTELAWGDISKSLFYTIILFTGEFNERVLEPTLYPVFGRVIMTLFIFCMTIILNNLLVGLIVADMNDIQQKGRLYKQIKLACFIQSTNKIIKRLHSYKHFKFVKRIIYFIDIFKKGKEKVLYNVDVHRFDEENRKYLKEIGKIHIFNRHMLKDVYNEVLKKDEP